MKNAYHLLCILFLILAFTGFKPVCGQDTLITVRGKLLIGKITTENEDAIKYIPSDNSDGPVYIIDKSIIHSVKYQHRDSVVLNRYKGRRNWGDLHQNIAQLNTWVFDLAGFGFLSVSQAYERRLKNGKVGFRIPLYIGFIGGGFAGMGTFKPRVGCYYASNYYFNNSPRTGYCLASGLNVKYYLVKRRIIRPFIGPEATVGCSAIHSQPGVTTYINSFVREYYTNDRLTAYGTMALLGKVGLTLNPIDKFNITFDGGAGIGDVFGANPNPVGWTGVWQIGFSLGTNF